MEIAGRYLNGHIIVKGTQEALPDVLTFRLLEDAQEFVKGELKHYDVLVTRHEGLVTYLKLKGYTWDVQITHATKEDLMGKHVLGVLPMSLARYAESVTECSMNLPEELRGVDLTLEQMEPYAGEIITYLPPRVAKDWM